MKIQAACVQMKSELGNVPENLRIMKESVERIMAENPGTDLIVFPECAVTGYECPELLPGTAQTWPDGPGISFLCDVAKRNGVFLVFGFAEKGEDGIYNSAGLIDRNGNPAGRYRKTHLVEGMETETFRKGDSFPVFRTEIGDIGIMICWDSAFPEPARILTLNGAQLIVVPEAVETGIEREWDLALQARAFDNTAYLLSCNHSGTDRALTFFGRSALVSPLGVIEKQLNGKEDILLAEIDYDAVTEAREYFYMLRQRRPSIYSELVK